MRSQSIRLFIYSSLAIIALTAVWGYRHVPTMSALAEHQLRNSLEQELSVLTVAVKASTNAMKYRLLDVLKADGNDRHSPVFQDSPFAFAALLEWDSNQWRILWHSTKLKDSFQETSLKSWMQDWPLAKISNEEAFFAKVGEAQGQPYFALVVPVRKPNNTPMLGVGIFPAAQFGLEVPADHTREIRVFDNKGFALALAHPAYVGSSVKREPIVEEILDGDILSVRSEWKSERGLPMIGLASRLSDSNLAAAIETKTPFNKSESTQAWIYLILCALGAVIINWVLFSSLIRPLFYHLAKTEELVVNLRKQLTDRPAAMMTAHEQPQEIISTAELPNIDFIEAHGEKSMNSVEAGDQKDSRPAEVPLPVTTLDKIVRSALSSLGESISASRINVNRIGLSDVEVRGDALQLQMAIEEILKNAIEAMQDSELRQLTIEAHQSSGRVKITIDDTGCGIAEEHLRQVFDPFFSTKRAEGPARGLGLNVVRRVFEELQGRVLVHNRQGTSGVCVEIEWPIVKSEEQLIETPHDQTNIFNEIFDDTLDPSLEMAFFNTTKRHPTIRKPMVRSAD